MASGLVKVKVDDTNLKKRLSRILRKIDTEGNLTVSEVARFGRDQIQMFMPKDTSQSAMSIGYQTVVNAPGYHEAQILQISYPHPDKILSKKNPVWFNIPLWMFTSDKAIQHYRNSNGSIIAMRNVEKTLEKEFGVKVTRKLKDPTIFK